MSNHKKFLASLDIIIKYFKEKPHADHLELLPVPYQPGTSESFAFSVYSPHISPEALNRFWEDDMNCINDLVFEVYTDHLLKKSSKYTRDMFAIDREKSCDMHDKEAVRRQLGLPERIGRKRPAGAPPATKRLHTDGATKGSGCQPTLRP